LPCDKRKLVISIKINAERVFVKLKLYRLSRMRRQHKRLSEKVSTDIGGLLNEIQTPCISSLRHNFVFPY
jgi:hypothetical protein